MSRNERMRHSESLTEYILPWPKPDPSLTLELGLAYWYPGAGVEHLGNVFRRI